MRYDSVKRELTQLLELVREGEATLGDARRKLIEQRDEERRKPIVQQEIERQFEEKRKELIKLSETYVGDEAKKAIARLAEEKSQGFPWLAKAYSDYLHLQDQQLADYLEIKPQPATRAAEHVREIAAKRRASEQAYRVLKYQLEYYENLFPWLIDFKGEDIDDLIIQIVEKAQRGREGIEEPEDGVVRHTTPGERKTLSRQELFQRALDRYWRKRKSPWEIGRDYERYIGYLYEFTGYSVYYQGIVEGLADLGRDLICVKDDDVEIVQCKYWSREKQIHEKHIFQLYGTAVAYRIDHPEKQVSPCFMTSTTLSDRARQFANELKVKVYEDHLLEHYPCIKCNVSRRDGTKIYHLPFDQQYDRTLIEEERNERYVETVKEAEELGFRRAFRWRGSSDLT